MPLAHDRLDDDATIAAVEALLDRPRLRLHRIAIAPLIIAADTPTHLPPLLLLAPRTTIAVVQSGAGHRPILLSETTDEMRELMIAKAINVTIVHETSSATPSATGLRSREIIVTTTTTAARARPHPAGLS